MKADKTEIVRLIKTARGQLDGVLRMVEDDRYCIDIVNQILAAQAILKKANREILKAHMAVCITDAVEAEDATGKIKELVDLLDKMSK